MSATLASQELQSWQDFGTHFSDYVYQHKASCCFFPEEFAADHTLVSISAGPF
jgi:hypothetical protein